MIPLVLLHGFLGAPGSFDPLLAALGEQGPVTAPLLPGHGPAPWLPEGSFDDVVDALAARLPAGPPSLLVGYSLGARLALGLALRHQASFAGAVLIGVHPGLTGRQERETRASSDSALALALRTGGLAAFVRSWEALPLFASQSRLPAALLAAQRATRLSHIDAGAAWALENLGLARMPPRLDAVRGCRLPLLLVTGAEDRKFSGLAAQLRAAAPLARTELIAGAGHNLLLEAPVALAALLRAGRAGIRGRTPWTP